MDTAVGTEGEGQPKRLFGLRRPHRHGHHLAAVGVPQPRGLGDGVAVELVQEQWHALALERLRLRVELDRVRTRDLLDQADDLHRGGAYPALLSRRRGTRLERRADRGTDLPPRGGKQGTPIRGSYAKTEPWRAHSRAFSQRFSPPSRSAAWPTRPAATTSSTVGRRSSRRACGTPSTQARSTGASFPPRSPSTSRVASTPRRHRARSGSTRGCSPPASSP